MTPTPLRDGTIAVRAAVSPAAASRRDLPFAAPRRVLEEFWPSRRSHAYDEFCR